MPVGMPHRKPQPKVETVLCSAKLDLREARDLLVHVLRKPLSFLIAHPETTLTPAQVEKFRTLVSKRRRGVPFAYLTGHQGFYGLDFGVTKDVLIPRPETEQLVDWVLAKVNRQQPVTIADVGTGSGCIAVTLAKYLPNAHIIASDVSAKALLVARGNARAHGVLKRIAFRRGSLLAALRHNEQPDIVVANLPYLTKPQLKAVSHEPKLALHGGKQGLELIEKLIQQIAERGIPQAILEIDPQQEPWLEAIVAAYSKNTHMYQRDLSGRLRFLELAF